MESTNSSNSLDTYSPINTLKRIANDVWIIDGPLIHFGTGLIKIPFSTRTTVIRLNDNDLFIHSPTPITDSLKQELMTIGQVKWIIAPNRIHYWWVPDWKAAYPDAEIYLAPNIRKQAGDHITFNGLRLEDETGYPWDKAIATLPIAGSFMTEVEFFHRASGTLILTDFIENIEPKKIHSFFLRLLTYFGGVQAPNGKMPLDMRFTFLKQKSQLKAAIEKIISWNPERIILAHGKCIEHNGTEELRRAYKWLLG